MYKYISTILTLGFFTPSGNHKRFEKGVYETKNIEVAKHLETIPQVKRHPESADPFKAEKAEKAIEKPETDEGTGEVAAPEVKKKKKTEEA